MYNVLIIYDVEGWAWHHMAKGIAAHAQDEYRVQLVNSQTWADMTKANPRWQLQFDGVLQMSWAEGATRWQLKVRQGIPKRLESCLVTTVIANDGPRYREIDEHDWRTRIVTTIRNFRHATAKISDFDRAIVVNKSLHKHISEGGVFRVDSACIGAGVETNIFKPGPGSKSGPIRVGWCANPAGDSSVKGLDEIWRPIQTLVNPLEIHTCDNTNCYTNSIPQQEMAEWFRTLDIFCCTSCSEGSPLTVLEALASGVHVIATDVGHCSELGLGDNLLPVYKNEVEARHTVGRFVKRIQEFTRGDAVDLSEQIETAWSWKVLSPKWLRFIVKGET